MTPEEINEIAAALHRLIQAAQDEIKPVPEPAAEPVRTTGGELPPRKETADAPVRRVRR